MRFVGRGHPAIRATHDKTLELSVDTDITERATCVIAVDARPDTTERIAGPVTIEITAGAETFTVNALANSSWHLGEPMIVRRSTIRSIGTFATHADATAADLPRTLVAALTDPATCVEVMVTPRPTEVPTVVLFAHDGTESADARLRAELAAADRVVTEDADARRRVGPVEGSGAGRILAVATADLPGARVLDELRAAGSVETVGLAPPFAAAAASSTRGPLTIAPDDADARELLRRTPAAHRLVLTTSAPRLADLLALGAEVRGPGEVVVVQPYAPPIRTDGSSVPDLAHQGGVVHCCFGPGAGDDGLDPAVRAAALALLEDGVATRAVARAVSALTDLDRRSAYDLVLGLRRT